MTSAYNVFCFSLIRIRIILVPSPTRFEPNPEGQEDEDEVEEGQEVSQNEDDLVDNALIYASLLAEQQADPNCPPPSSEMLQRIKESQERSNDEEGTVASPDPSDNEDQARDYEEPDRNNK